MRRGRKGLPHQGGGQKSRGRLVLNSKGKRGDPNKGTAQAAYPEKSGNWGGTVKWGHRKFRGKLAFRRGITPMSKKGRNVNEWHGERRP